MLFFYYVNISHISPSFVEIFNKISFKYSSRETLIRISNSNELNSTEKNHTNAFINNNSTSIKKHFNVINTYIYIT